MDSRRTATVIVVLAFVSALGIWWLTRPPASPSELGGATRASSPRLTATAVASTGSPAATEMPMTLTPEEAISPTTGPMPAGTETPQPTAPAAPEGAEVATSTLAPPVSPPATATLVATLAPEVPSPAATAVTPSPTIPPLPGETLEFGPYPEPITPSPPYP